METETPRPEDEPTTDAPEASEPVEADPEDEEETEPALPAG